MNKAETRICRKCGIEKPITNFQITHKRKSGSVKRRNTSRSCVNNQGKNIPTEKKMNVIESAKFKCYYCKRFGDTIDHFIPASAGGTNKYMNLVCACLDCNQRKGDMMPDEFIQLLINEGVRKVNSDQEIEKLMISVRNKMNRNLNGINTKTSK